MMTKLIIIPLVMLAVTTSVWNLWLEKRVVRTLRMWADKSEEPIFINPDEG